jgi:hypothetical protein
VCVCVCVCVSVREGSHGRERDGGREGRRDGVGRDREGTLSRSRKTNPSGGWSKDSFTRAKGPEQTHAYIHTFSSLCAQDLYEPAPTHPRTHPRLLHRPKRQCASVLPATVLLWPVSTPFSAPSTAAVPLLTFATSSSLSADQAPGVLLQISGS